MAALVWAFTLFLILPNTISTEVPLPRVMIELEHGVKDFGPVNTRATVPDWGTFTQNLDHFNRFDNRTWEMRYLNNSQFFQEGGPIFIYLGGEWTITQSALMAGQIYDMAEEHNGYMFYTEHRYYGLSFPTEDYSSANLRWLTTELALEDIANFIAYQKSLSEFNNSKVIVIGGSYSATLATWMRLKFPHLVDIAYSSSAPLEAIVDFYQYMEVVNAAIEAVSVECLETIEEGITEIEELLLDPNSTAYVAELFQLCDPDVDISVEPDRSYFFGQIIWSWAGIVQYARTGTIEAYCNVITETEGTAAEKLLAFLLSYIGSDSCLATYVDFVSAYNTTQLTSGASRQWYYQTCTEYGWYQTTATDSQPFRRNLLVDFFYGWCQDLYGTDEEILYDGVERSNLLYGAKDLEVTKVINVHGTIDPWHPAGVHEDDIHTLSPTIFIEGASHCQDLSTANAATDTPQMYAAKIRIKDIVREWLNDGEEDTTTSTTTTTSASGDDNTTSSTPGDEGTTTASTPDDDGTTTPSNSASSLTTITFLTIFVLYLLTIVK